MKRQPLGSVISGTLSEVDLFQAFLATLKKCEPNENNQQIITRIEKALENPQYLESEDSLWDLETLGDALNEYAPPYAYFGTTEGDGADFGFWLFPSFPDEYTGLRVSDLSQVPPGACGEVLVQNGSTMKLYEIMPDLTTPEETHFELIWSV